MTEQETKTKSVTVGGKTLTFETGKIARQANGAVFVSMGDTRILGTACSSKGASDEIDFLPLTVNYQERPSAAGRTPGGFLKRAGRPSERETLLSRLIDRPIRPMFPDGYYNEIQVLSSVWSYDSDCPPGALALCAASAALVISDIPLVKPIGAVQVGRIDDQWVINPTIKQQEVSTLDLMIAGTEDAILMIEGYCDFLTEEQVIDAINTGHAAIKEICKALSEWQKEIGKEKDLSALRPLPAGIMEDITALVGSEMDAATRVAGKQERGALFDAAKEKLLETFCAEENPKYSTTDMKIAFKKTSSQALRKLILEENMRPDRRRTDEVRSINIEQSILPRVHGSSLFTRGETQAMAVCTLGSSSMGQRYEDLEGEGVHRFYLHYTFPPFSVGEVGRMGPPGRREVGHGKLAERAIAGTLPTEQEFPYAVRLESNITESNGSSSMASVCGGCLAMMDAGVPIKRPVSGIAMGLILEGNEYKVLSDITGTEDALGDMDFKITGDADGITAFQMDIKVEGITPEIMKAALEQARDGRAHILGKMLQACPQPRQEMSKYAPKIETLTIKPSKIGTVIGPGGKMIREIIEKTKVEIDISDDGKINIVSADQASMEAAKGIINSLVAEVEIGQVYNGKIVSIVPFGAFIEILPGQQGLCHISEVAHERIENVSDVLNEGELVDVKVLDINERGQIKLSRKAILSRT